MCRFFLFVCVFLLVSSAVNAAIITSMEMDELHLTLGNQSNNTGFFIGIKADGSKGLIGSVTMYNGYNGFVTQHQQALGDFTSYAVRLRGNSQEPLNLFDNYVEYNVSNIVNHPSYGGLTFGYDFGILHFHEEIPGIDQLHLYTGERNVGDVYRFFGGGMVGVPGGESPILDGYIRGGFNRLTSLSWNFEYNGIEDSYLQFRFDDPNSPNHVEGEFYTWNHDSGGGIYTSMWELAALQAGRGPLSFGALGFGTPIPHEFIENHKYHAPPSEPETVVSEPSAFMVLCIASLTSIGGVVLRRWNKVKLCS